MSKEYAVFHGQNSYITPMQSFGRWQEETVERLKRRLRFFEKELSRETDSRKRSLLRKSLDEVRSELRKEFLSWKQCEFRQQLINRRETGFVMQQDKLLMNTLHTESDDIERGYQLAGRIISRNRRLARTL